MPIVQNLQDQIVYQNRQIDGINTLVPRVQNIFIRGRYAQKTLPTYNNIPATAITNGTEILCELRKGTCHKVYDLAMRLQVTAASAMQLNPASEWIDYIYAYAQNGSGDIIDRAYADNIRMYYYMKMLQEERKIWAHLSKFTEYEFADGTLRYNVLDFDNKSYLRAGESAYVYIPIPFHWLNNGVINMQHVNTIQFKVKFNSDCITAGTAADLSLNDFVFVMHSPEEAPDDQKKHVQDLKSVPHTYQYLAVERNQRADQTLTASSFVEYEIPFTHKSGFLIWTIKNNSNPVGLVRLQNLAIKGGTFDFVDVGGKSLLGLGTPPRESIFNEIWRDQFENKPPRGYYVIPFSDVKSAMKGQVKMYYNLDANAKDKIQINFPAAGTAHVTTITLSANATSGFYRLSNGNYFTSPLAYNTSNVNIALQINEYLAYDQGYTCTVNGDFSAGPVVITWNAKDLRITDEIPDSIQLISESLLNTGAGVQGTTTQSTYGSRGSWTTSANYQMNIFSYYYRQLVIDTNGDLKPRNM